MEVWMVVEKNNLRSCRCYEVWGLVCSGTTVRLLFVLILGGSVSIVTAAKAVLASGWIIVVILAGCGQFLIRST